MLLFLNIISLYTEALVPSFHKPLKTSGIKFFGLLSESGGDFPSYSFIVGKMFSRKITFKRVEQMSWPSECNLSWKISNFRDIL
jgi:hypothetical protein